MHFHASNPELFPSLKTEAPDPLDNNLEIFFTNRPYAQVKNNV